MNSDIMEFGLYEPNKFKDKFEYVTSPNITLKGRMTFDPNGIFSEVIWPYIDNARYVKLAAIDLSNAGIFLHPKVYELIKNRQKVLFEAINGKDIYFDEDYLQFKVLSKENENQQNIKGFRGLYALNEIISNLEKYKEAINPIIYAVFEKYKHDIFIQSIFVLPPALRDVQIVKDRIISTSDINPLYQKLIRLSNSTRINSKKILTTNLTLVDLSKLYRIQQIINEIYNQEKTMLGKKEGYIRQNILAKRIDFSGRAVIGVDPKLPLNRVKVPCKIMMKLLEPFIAYHIFSNQKLLDEFREAAGELITEYSFSKYITKLRKGHGSKKAYEIVKEVAKQYEGKIPVLLKRDPSLHMSSWQAFDFICTDDPIIYIPPLIVSGFNADFDGDQMAVTIPLTVEAQREVREKMMNHFVNAGNGSTETLPSQDTVLGPYLLTKDTESTNMTYLKYGDVSLDELQINPQIPFNAVITYVGSLGKTQMKYGNYIYNMLFLKVFKEPYLGVVNKSVIKQHVDLARKKLNKDDFVKLMKKLVEISGIVVNMNPITIHPEELDVPEDIIAMKNKILKEYNFIEAEKKIKEEVMPKLKKWLKSKNSGLYYMIDSGARGGWSDVEQLLIAKGYIADGTGKISLKPIVSSLVEGLEPQEVMQMGPAAAKGTQDRSLGTQKTGELERELVFTAQSVMISDTKDCKTQNYLVIKVESKDEAKALRYRYCKEIGLITDENYEKIVGKEIHLRSPLLCTAKDGVCETCYGTLHKLLKTRNVGIIAGQSVGERGTQLIMKTFHTGGKAELDVTTIPYLNELYPDVDKYIKQVKDVFYSKNEPIKIVANSKDIDITYVDGESIFIKNGFFSIVDEKDENPVVVDLFKFPIDFGITIDVDGDVSVDIDNYNYVISIPPNVAFGKLVFTQKDMSTSIKYISNLFHAKLYTDDYIKLYKTLANLYASMGVLSIHIEVILSQMMRVKGQLELLWRHHQDKEYQIISTKSVIYYDSPILSIGFQNISKALDIALISNKKHYVKGPLEKFALNEIEPSTKITDFFK